MKIMINKNRFRFVSNRQNVLPNAPFFPNEYVEVNSHILNGLTDGSKSIENSIELLQNFYNLGIRNILCTFRVSDGDLDHQTSRTYAWFESLKKWANQDQHLKNLTLNLSAVYVLDDRFPEISQKGKLQSYQNKWVFLELPQSSSLSDWKKLIGQLRQQGYNPILTQTERNRCFHHDLAQFFELKSTGCFFQIGLDSFTKEEDLTVNTISHWLLRNHLVDFITTDFYAPNQFYFIPNLTQTPFFKESLDPMIRKTNFN